MPGIDDRYVRWFETLGSDDVALVGGKNASLGEMISALSGVGIRVPAGFATTAGAYREFLAENDLDGPLAGRLAAYERGEATLEETGRWIREAIRGATLSGALGASIVAAYRELGERYDAEDVDVAVRSSATAEDLPEASFAGQQETYLNVRGEEALLEKVRDCFASLFTDRAIVYRDERGFDHLDVALSVGVQKMVRSDLAGAGVLFTIDTETGFPDVVRIDAAWGLGEAVVGGTVDPDHYSVYKPFLADPDKVPILWKDRGRKATKIVYARSGPEPTVTVETRAVERRAYVLSDDEVLTLARWGAAIEAHYGRPMDIEGARDGNTDELYVVQARPETVQSRRGGATISSYSLVETGEVLVEGAAVGDAIAAAKACVLEDVSGIDRFEAGCILVTRRTDPDWMPIMRQAAAIVTDHGGRTSHAAIVSRELGIPAVVGTGDATRAIEDGREITLSCAEGERGVVYDGLLEYEVTEIELDGVPETRTRVMMNIASPMAAMRWWRLPARGVGLARVELVVGNQIAVHPMALVDVDRVEDPADRLRIEQLTMDYDDRGEYFVDRLAWGIGTIAASRYPDPVIVRTSDFKTNEYADLIGGKQFEPSEENPMLGWRGAARYYSEKFRAGFALECRAIKRARETMGFDNVIVMIPFCRTPEEADRVLGVMAEHGLARGENGLKVYVMAEIPSNVLQADEFAERFDGFSIGSNDLTQLTLGVDRDAPELAYLFDERNRSVKRLVTMLIEAAHGAGKPVGICGQAPSDYPEFAEFLVEAGIDSISLNPDTIVSGLRTVAEAESRLAAGARREVVSAPSPLPAL